MWKWYWETVPFMILLFYWIAIDTLKKEEGDEDEDYSELLHEPQGQVVVLLVAVFLGVCWLPCGLYGICSKIFPEKKEEDD